MADLWLCCEVCHVVTRGLTPSLGAAVSLPTLVTGAGFINITATSSLLTGFQEMILNLGMSQSL